MKTMHSGNAPPKRESMTRDAPLADESDARAVDWWRHHPHGNGSADVMSKSELDRILDNSEETTQASNNHYQRQQQRQQDLQQQIHPADVEQKSQGRMENRDPLQKPYGMNRELPIRPKNGNVLHPQIVSSTAPSRDPSVSGTTSRTDGSSSNLERFEAQLDTTSESAPQLRIQRETPTFEEHMVIARVDSHETIDSNRHPVDPPGTPTHTSSHRYSMTKNRNNNGAHEITETPSKKKKLPLSKFIEKKSATAKLRSREESDHLSDVPSDVDSVIRERYLLACQMLKTTMIQKEKALIPIEKEYILSLLGDFERDCEDSVFSEEQLSAIEKATLKLERDPVFDQPVLAKNQYAPSPARAARSQQSSTKSQPVSSFPKEPPGDQSFEAMQRNVNDKNPHTATRKPKNKFIKTMTNPCNPRSAMGARGEVSHDVVNVVHEDQMEYEQWDDPELNDRSKDELVRFDGWSFQRSIEYPFLILGADGDDLNPRVMTPSMMEALRGFMPYRVSESNFWMKYSLVRDGASLATLLASVRGSTYTLIGVETNHGEVFGSFSGTPWRISGKWYGNGEAFLWRLKKPRYTSPTNSRKPNFEREMEVYPYTGYDEMVQFCTAKTIAVGGGDWLGIPCPFNNDTKGIGFMIDGDLAG
jgi:hypothetical protein